MVNINQNVNSEHPFLLMYDVLNNDEKLNSMLNDMRDKKDDNNMIFTYYIGETYQKRELSPFIRLVPIVMVESVWSDNDSPLYELSFSVEVFTQGLSDSYKLSSYITKLYKEQNCICYSVVPQYDETFDLYNSFMKFKIYVNKGDF